MCLWWLTLSKQGTLTNSSGRSLMSGRGNQSVFMPSLQRLQPSLPLIIYCNVWLFCLLECRGADKGHFLIHMQSITNTVGRYKSVRDGRCTGVSCCWDQDKVTSLFLCTSQDSCHTQQLCKKRQRLLKVFWMHMDEIKRTLRGQQRVFLCWI